jgi:hypothetical protein
MTTKDNNTKQPVSNSTSQVSSKPGRSPDRAEPSKEVAATRGNFQTRQPPPQPLSKAKSVMTTDKPRPTPQEVRETYYKWLERLEAKAREDQETRARLDSTRELITRLEESNILAVYRLVEIFGLSLVKEKVDKALALHKEATEQGEVAYKPKENPRATRPEHRLIGTEVATAKGQPRTPGGIFFFLMRGYVTRIRLAWEDLRVPWLPDEVTQNTATATGAEGQTNEVNPDEASKANGKRNQDGSGGSEPTSGISKISDPLVNTLATAAGSTATKASVVGSLVQDEQGVKPSSGKVVITGSPKPGSQIKVAPQGLAGVLELLFEIEPGANPAKGLPVLEKTLVKVWCTEKQYNKIKPSLNPNSRYLIEGEIGAGINSQTFQPFIRVLTTRITTLELEQEAKQKKVDQNNPA